MAIGTLAGAWKLDDANNLSLNISEDWNLEIIHLLSKYNKDNLVVSYILLLFLICLKNTWVSVLITSVIFPGQKCIHGKRSCKILASVLQDKLYVLDKCSSENNPAIFPRFGRKF